MMPPTDDQNSDLNRRAHNSAAYEETEHEESEEISTVNSSESDWYSEEIEDDAVEYDLSLKFEDYAPAWLIKVKALFGHAPEWSVSYSLGATAIVLTILLLLAMPADEPAEVEFVEEFTPPPVEVVSVVREEEDLIDSRISVELPLIDGIVLAETDPLYVSFGELPQHIADTTPHEEFLPPRERPIVLPDFELPPEPAAAEPELTLNVQHIRIIEREMLDPGIDELFLVEAVVTAGDMVSRLEPGDRFLFDEKWTLVNLERTLAQSQEMIRPTLYHERVTENKHLQVGQEQLLEPDLRDSVRPDPGRQEELHVEIRKTIPQQGIAANTLAYSIIVKNQGTTPAFDVDVNETLSPAASLVDLTPPAEVRQNQLSWKIDRLEPQEERELQVKVYLAEEGSVETNSLVKLVSHVATTTEIFAPSLELKIKGPDVIAEGEVFPLEIQVSNRGRQDQNSVNLNLDLPEGLMHEQGRQLSFHMDQLAANETRTLQARVRAVKAGKMTSQASLSSDSLPLEETVLVQNVVPKPVTPKQPDTKATKPATPAPTVPPNPPVAPGQQCPCQLPVIEYYTVPYLLP
ncbi:MAG: DUF11 domain-containing protein [Planctomycetaceae bacterium]|nr:DUF11 domain-containing protein [Planctomycetaceae bacterium]